MLSASTKKLLPRLPIGRSSLKNYFAFIQTIQYFIEILQTLQPEKLQDRTQH